MPASYDIDDSRFPLIHVHYRSAMSDQEFEELLGEFDQLMATRTRPYALIVETHHSKMTPLGQARRQAEWMKQRASAMRKKIVGIALVLPSPVLRGVLKVVLQLQPMPVPYAVFNDAAAALAWAEPKLKG